MADPGWNEAITSGGAPSIVTRATSWVSEHWIMAIGIAVGILIVVILIVWGITKAANSSSSFGRRKGRYMAVPGAPEPSDISIARNTGIKSRSGMATNEADQKLREAVGGSSPP